MVNYFQHALYVNDAVHGSHVAFGVRIPIVLSRIPLRTKPTSVWAFDTRYPFAYSNRPVGLQMKH